MAYNFDLHVHETGALAVALALWAVSRIVLFMVVILVKSRYGRIIMGLGEPLVPREPSAAVFADSPKPDNDIVVGDSTREKASGIGTGTGVGSQSFEKGRGIATRTAGISVGVDDSGTGMVPGIGSVADDVDVAEVGKRSGTVGSSEVVRKKGISGGGVDFHGLDTTGITTGNTSEKGMVPAGGMGSILEEVDDSAGEVAPRKTTLPSMSGTRKHSVTATLRGASQRRVPPKKQ